MTRVMLIGSVGAGKTTLAHVLAGDARSAEKTQATTVVGDVIDTPGEYLDHGRLNHALLLSSHEADLVVMLMSVTDDASRLPPGFASYFTCPVVGVVSKVDVSDDAEVEYAREQLALAGADPILSVSAYTGQGVGALQEVIRRGGVR